MLPSFNLVTSRSVLICFSSLLLVACQFSASSSVVAAVLWQDQPEVLQREERLSDDDKAKLDDALEIEDPQPQQNMFANMGLDPNRMKAAKRFRLTQTFRVEVDELSRVLKLDSKQQKKLSIAAKGATQKLLARWIEKNGMGKNAADDQASKTDDEELEFTDAEQIDENTLMMMEMNANGNPFGGTAPQRNPVWKNMLKKVLTPEQLTTLKTFRADQAKKKKAAMAATMMQILNTELGLSPAQSDELQVLIAPHVEAAKPVSLAVYDMFLTLYYASKVDKASLEKLLSDAQHQKWKLLMMPMKQIGQMVDQQQQNEAVEVVEE